MGALAARTALSIGIAVAALLIGMPAAGAAPPTFTGAGYVLSGAREVTMNFRVPTMTCSSSERYNYLDVGAFSSDTSYRWWADADLSCNDGFFDASMLVEGDGGGAFETVAPGDRIRIVLTGLHTPDAAVSIDDLDMATRALRLPLGQPVAHVAVGAQARRSFPFTTVEAAVTVNSGQPFTAVPHTHRDEIRRGVTVIHAGKPNSDGAGFPLIFKNR